MNVSDFVSYLAESGAAANFGSEPQVTELGNKELVMGRFDVDYDHRSFDSGLLSSATKC